EYLIRKYTDIYFISSAYVSDSARRALLYAWGKGVKLHNVTIMLDKYGNQRLPFNKTDTDATPPTVKAALGDGFIAGIADDVGSGINRIEVTIGGKVLIAQGTDTWSVETKDKKGVASIVAVDNNGNRSEEVRIEIK
ncbi:MAG TPA: hypothetical protein PLZ84_02900, partial [Clostridia bacterium]|nr:hypothetical protein [Clostridia bacterium]